MNTNHRVKKTIRSLASFLALGAVSPVLAQSSAFDDLVDNGDGTYTNWIGTFSAEGGGAPVLPGYILHEEHGRLYVTTGGQDVWIYDWNVAGPDNGLGGWIYTNRTIYPWFYALNVTNDGGAWVHYLDGVPGPEATPRIFLAYPYTPVLFAKRETRNIAEIATLAGLSELVGAVGAADPAVAAALTGSNKLTVFAPSNAAFQAISEVTAGLSTAALTDILLYHVVPGDLSAADLTLDTDDIFNGESNTFYVTTANGADLRLDVTPFGVLINNDAMVSLPNVEASNGIAHVIDSVLLPPANLATVANDNGFTTLVTAVGAAAPAVGAALTGDSPLTVFAPTNEAFSDLGATLSTLLETENQGQLTEILLYHVVPGRVYASEVPLGTPVATANTAGDTVTFTTDAEGNLFVNDAKILSTNVIAGNGVIHVIDKVITPPPAIP